MRALSSNDGIPYKAVKYWLLRRACKSSRWLACYNSQHISCPLLMSGLHVGGRCIGAFVETSQSGWLTCIHYAYVNCNLINESSTALVFTYLVCLRITCHLRQRVGPRHTTDLKEGIVSTNKEATMLGMVDELRKMNVREVLHQGINLGTNETCNKHGVDRTPPIAALIVTSALMLWKGLVVVTGSESPVRIHISLQCITYHGLHRLWSCSLAPWSPAFGVVTSFSCTTPTHPCTPATW